MMILQFSPRLLATLPVKENNGVRLERRDGAAVSSALERARTRTQVAMQTNQTPGGGEQTANHSFPLLSLLHPSRCA